MKIDLATRTLFAEFQESVFKRMALTKELKSTHTFVRKRVKKRIYWYKQHYRDGQYKQQYFGPSNTKNDEHVELYRHDIKKRKSLLKQLLQREIRQAAMLRRGGLPGLDKSTADVIGKLSDCELLSKSGILIGTFAFMAYSGILGYLFEHMLLKTNDIDIVRDESIKVVAKNTVNLSEILAKSGKEFRGVPSLDSRKMPSSFISSDGLRVDLITTLRGRPRGSIQVKGIIGATAIPLPFIDYLIKNPIKAVLISPSGGIPILVPDPARFACHKLIVAMRRPITDSAKRKKDLDQAAQLISVLAEEHLAELKSAYRSIAKYGKKWSKLIKKASNELPEDIRNLLV